LDSVPIGNINGSDPGSNPEANRLIARMEADDYNALRSVAKVVRLRSGARLLRQDQPIDAVYFPLTSVVSLVFPTKEKPTMEIATVGREGVVGSYELLEGLDAVALHLVQVPGTALRIDADRFRERMAGRPLFEVLLRRHFYALMRQIIYVTACNRLHTMPERCARWLLMAHDRAGQDTFLLTQNSLSHILGVRRATANAAMGTLKKAGLIRYARGTMTAVDRSGLESAACDCYHAIVTLYDSAIP
jgi:CRP-like cAMP-binding protein